MTSGFPYGPKVPGNWLLRAKARITVEGRPWLSLCSSRTLVAWSTQGT